MNFDAVLLLSFGGPNGPADVRPFLANVLRGRPVPQERIDQVAEHYMLFGGRSPINDQNRSLLEAIGRHPGLGGRRLYWGNRNWAPFVTDTVAQMAVEGVARAAVFVTSAYSSYSGCRQYLEDLDRARAPLVASGRPVPELVKLRPFFNHPGFVEPLADGLRAALAACSSAATVVMTAHSIPSASAATCDFEAQLRSTASLVAAAAGCDSHQVAYQSRSGAPGQPWLEPDILDVIDRLAPGTELVVCPIGFVSDHMEVVYDLDTQAAERARSRGVRLVRTPTPGVDPRFVDMVFDLIASAEDPAGHPPVTLGPLASHPCPCDRCLAPGPPPTR